MNTSPFEFKQYKAFVLARIKSSPNQGRGVRRLIAESLGCQVAYVSHVLAGEKHFSIEQAEAAARFFELREDETEYFLLQVELLRAGTPALKKYLSRQIEKRLRQYQEVSQRIQITDTISPVDQATYYSNWHFQAVRTVLTIPECRTAQAIAARLGLEIERTNEVLSFLLVKGLVRESANGYLPTDKQIHLPRSSPLISKLHTNWRVRTLSALERNREEDFHYSGVVTLSEVDYLRVREVLVQALQNSIDIVKPSKEEKLCVLGLDFFEL